MAKITKCFNYVNFYFHGVLKFFGRGYIFCQKKFGCAKEARFNTKTAISAMNVKLRVTLNTILDTCFNSDPFLG